MLVGMWPSSFKRIPDDDWTHHPLETLALKYDTVENHGWYKNLDPTVRQLAEFAGEGHVVIDYSGGTGIFADRLLRAVGPRRVGIVIVDASTKFLRLALEKLGRDERVAFRLIRYLKEPRRLEFVDEVVGLACDALVSTNAIHLYYDLPDTLAAWTRALKPGAGVFVQSGNIRNPSARPGEWIIDETVERIHQTAAELAYTDARWAPYRAALEDAALMEKHAALRRKYFLPVRPLEYYVDAMARAGFTIRDAHAATVDARTDEWYQFLSVYHEGVLGWVGGSEKVEGAAPSRAAVADRLELMARAMDVVFGGRASFPCCWTYVTARR